MGAKKPALLITRINERAVMVYGAMKPDYTQLVSRSRMKICIHLDFCRWSILRTTFPRHVPMATA